HDPDAHAFLTPRVDIARHLQRVRGVAGVQAAAMLVLQALFAADKNFPKRPLFQCRGVAHAASFCCRCCCLWAWASAASRTHWPCSWALTRVDRRSLLQGPLPLTVSQNSSQSI